MLAERLDVLADISSRHPFGPWRAWCRCYRGSLHLLNGDFSQAVEDLAAGLDALERTHWPVRRAMFLGHHAQALDGLGKVGEATACVEEAINSCRTTGEGWILPELVHIRAGIIAPERPDAALACLDEAWRIAHGAGMRSWALRSMTTAARLAPHEPQISERLRSLLASSGDGQTKPDYRKARDALARMAISHTKV